MDPYRFISLYLGFTTFGIFFGILGIKVLKRDPKDRLNQFISLFYFFSCVSLIVNLIYSTIKSPALQELASFLGVTTVYFMMLGLGFLVLFTQLLYKPQLIEKTRNQIILILIYASLLSTMFIIPDGLYIIIQSDGTQFPPIFNLPFTIFNLINVVLTASLVLINSRKIYKSFNNKELAKRFKFFIIGVFIFYILCFHCLLANYLNLYVLRQLHTFLQIFVIFGLYFIYFGMGVPRKNVININYSIEEESALRLKEL